MGLRFQDKSQSKKVDSEEIKIVSTGKKLIIIFYYIKLIITV